MYWRAIAAEFLATLLLLAVVVGSGIMGETLAGGNVAIALLANSVATGTALVALILAFGPTSGAHMNPAVTLAAAATAGFSWTRVPAYAAAQVAGGLAGVAVAHGMFEQPAWTASAHARAGLGQALAEFVATFSLVTVVLACGRTRPGATPFAVGAIVTAGYWFTASTSFANPAVTIARATTATFAGIRPADVLPFVLAQLLGALGAVAVFRSVLSPPRGKS